MFTALVAQLGYIVPQAYELYITSDRGGGQTQQRKQTRRMEENNIHKNIFRLGFVKVISSPHKGDFRGVFLANHLASTDN